MKANDIPIEFMERMKEIERESRFWQKLKDIGFNVRIQGIMNISTMSHYCLPIHHSFEVDTRKMVIMKMTIETGSWLIPVDITEPLMTCENFIKYQVLQIRKMTSEVLDKLDTVTL